MTNGALNLKEMKIMYRFITAVFSRSTWVIYLWLYSDYKNIRENIPWEWENIKVIALVITIL